MSDDDENRPPKIGGVVTPRAVAPAEAAGWFRQTRVTPRVADSHIALAADLSTLAEDPELAREFFAPNPPADARLSAADLRALKADRKALERLARLFDPNGNPSERRRAQAILARVALIANRDEPSRAGAMLKPIGATLAGQMTLLERAAANCIALGRFDGLAQYVIASAPYPSLASLVVPPTHDEMVRAAFEEMNEMAWRDKYPEAARRAWLALALLVQEHIIEPVSGYYDDGTGGGGGRGLKLLLLVGEAWGLSADPTALRELIRGSRKKRAIRKRTRRKRIGE